MDTAFLWDEISKSKRPRLFNLLSLHALKVHKTANGVLDVRSFSTAIGKSHECVYKWLRRDYFLPKNIDSILHNSARSLTKKMLIPYVSKHEKKKKTNSRFV
jgi:hypothetical protein